MALMPEDLENKRFTPVRFSEGYDMDEVDEYLDDEILPRLRELIDENNRLTKELEEAQNRVAELETAAQEAQAAAPVANEVPETTDEPVDPEDAQVEETPAVEETVESDETVAADEPAQTAVADTEAQPLAADSAKPQDAAGIIALANRLHDEYVKNGEDERDRLITEANAEHQRIIGEAEETSRTTLADMESKKAELEKTIEGLRTFERDYRNRLRTYLENQLQDLDSSETQDKQASDSL